MPETETNPGKPPRFPYFGALLCVACVIAAVWTWMRYSYCWTYELDELPGALRRYGAEGLYGRYVRIPAPIGPLGMSVLVGPSHDFFFVNDGTTPFELTIPRGTDEEEWVTHGSRGRIRVGPHTSDSSPCLFFDTRATRFTGASIAGLVVGAMGVFVFAVALRHWLGERRATTALEAS